MENLHENVSRTSPSVSPRANYIHSPPNDTKKIHNNQVGTVLLHGVHIVSLVIDNKERLCLAQISNTLLKKYSYNEIHNRRVALGITCVQCTPVQLEILRRAGAMPVSSRRCGMITRREAERLVKSFLEEITPPRLPENFSFDVQHRCGWGCRGEFLPARYNSSRAKCIKCAFCGMFFSPNKFIFHFHRLPEAKYTHPDAANFNSWRRHIKLSADTPADDLVQAWEDVKAMFNGGSRKRTAILGSPKMLESHIESRPTKKPKSDESVPNKEHMPNLSQSNFPLYLNHDKPSSFYTPPRLPNLDKSRELDRPIPPNCRPPWLPHTRGLYNPYDMIWNQPFCLSGLVRHPMSQVFRTFSPSSPGFREIETPRTEIPGKESNCISPQRPHPSAFKPVRSLVPQRSPHARSPEPTQISESEEKETTHSIVDEQDEVDVDTVEENNNEGKQTQDDKSNNHVENREESTEMSDPGDDHVEGELNDHQEIEVDSEKEERQDICIDGGLDKEHKNNGPDVFKMSPDELRDKLMNEIEARKRLEDDCKTVKESLENKVKDELLQREKFGQKLQDLKDALYLELDQERKARLELQEKLKEAHGALHNFSCKMMAVCPCADCRYDKVGSPR